MIKMDLSGYDVPMRRLPELISGCARTDGTRGRNFPLDRAVSSAMKLRSQNDE